MAKKKNRTFIFNVEWQEVLVDYPPEVRLEVYEAIIEYVASGTLSELKPLAKMAFSFIKKEVDYNLESYNEVSKARSEAGKKGMRKRWGGKRDGMGDDDTVQDVTNITNVMDDNKDNNDNKPYQDVTNITYNDNYIYNPPLTPPKAGDEREEPSGTKPRNVIPPPIDEVREYCLSRGGIVNADEFMDFYASKGWIVGKNRMKDWQAAVRTWEIKRSRETGKDNNHEQERNFI
jgi:hypothetical protein|nr:MAG TPA: hypothetical protein [Caudoviricetes sp.]DAV99498.1 MAG TPA: hypothetical protein [Caudoviricetes sp.]